MATVVVLGAGGWGTALAVTAERTGHTVTLWSPFEEEIADIRRHGEHRKLLPGIPVPPSVELTTDPSCVQTADLLIMAVPSFAILQTAQRIRPFIKDGCLIANAGKGLEETTYRRFSEILETELPMAKVVVLSGPSHAEEVGRGVPTLLVCASRDAKAAQKVRDMLMSSVFRLYTCDDTIGVELGGALKNVIALAAGICDGLELGDNTKAALMTRGLTEIARLGVKLGAQAETFAGLSGMGDLIVTCGSMHSRNRRAGILIGKGMTAEEAVKQVGTVEGYLAAKTAHEFALREQVEMPITEACYRICYENISPRDMVSLLMSRPGKHEQETNWLK